MKPKHHSDRRGRRLPFLVGLVAVGVLFVWAIVVTSAAPPRERASPHLTPLTPTSVPKVATYTLRARLDPEAKEVAGEGTILFRNPSSQPARALYFHLYLNAFESDKTLFLRGKASRSGGRRGDFGKITVHSLTSPTFSGKNLWPKDAHSPGDAQDRTDIRVPLPRPLLGGESIELEIEFTSKLPQVVERTGYERDFFLVAQWFPKLAKREPGGKWAHFPFHPNGEFYADFGDYDVTLEVPERFVVGTTGVLSELERHEPTLKRYRARAEGVHDFAWTAWPHFESETRTLHGVTTRVLSPRNMPRVREKTWNTLERGLTYLGEAFGPYPHPTLTVVTPPTFASRAGGMEYPQFITTGGSEPFTYLGVLDVELVTIHELAHQWFQGMLASNEMEHPFLDEGLTSYAETRYLEDTYGDGALLSFMGLQISRTAGSRYVGLKSPGQVPIASAAPDFESFRAIGSLVYARSALCLETLRRVYGDEKLEKALAVYAERYRFRHPRPRDFYGVLGEVLGEEARIQVELMFERQGTIDLSVSSVETVRQGSDFVSTIDLRKAGKLSFPSSLRVLMSDGSAQRIPLAPWNGNHTVRLVHRAPIRFAEVDPKQLIVLDENLENNRKAPRSGFPSRDQQFHSALAMASWALSWLTP